jgi:hypothetical protein
VLKNKASKMSEPLCSISSTREPGVARADEDADPCLAIGPIGLANRVLLAPMSGVSDRPFRQTAHRLGAGLVVSEMIASEELVRERRDVLRRTEFSGERPFALRDAKLDGWPRAPASRKGSAPTSSTSTWAARRAR